MPSVMLKLLPPGLLDRPQLAHRSTHGITLEGNNATAGFKLSPEVDEQSESAHGTYKKRNPAGANGGVEQLNLINEYEYIGLFRD
jgi:hypothetical protein